MLLHAVRKNFFREEFFQRAWRQKMIPEQLKNRQQKKRERASCHESCYKTEALRWSFDGNEGT